MAQVMEIIKGRRSIRKYQEKEVPKKILQQILKTARLSPTWAETQRSEVIVVKDQAKKEKLWETLGKSNPAKNAVVQAPVVLALCGKKMSSRDYKNQSTKMYKDLVMFDLGIAAQTLCLIAYDLGLGTVIVGDFDHDKAQEALRVPKGYEIVALIPLGYPTNAPTPPKRREISEFIHYDKF